MYLHWTVSPYQCKFTDYNFEIILVDGKWQMVMTHTPLDNLPGFNNNSPASHTWHRNTGAIGISVTGMDGSGVGVHNYGDDPITIHEIEFMCALAAMISLEYGIDVAGKVASPGENHADNVGHTVNTTGEKNILTHGECAVIDAYPTERIDLCSMIPLPPGVELTPAIRTQTGEALRSRIHAYKVELLKG
jgi:hypothetical protein